MGNREKFTSEMAEMTDKKVKKNWKVMKVSLEKVAAILYESKKILVDVMVIVKICDHDDMLTRPSSMTKALQPETSVEFHYLWMPSGKSLEHSSNRSLAQTACYRPYF
ncbi:uncharacterized protein [Argopecten irradians]|uniref:uncharacterized protein isoform X2 n=1 Tax=Argopecten irradians TaxID=31199 RepID=UPI003711D7D2